MNGIRLGLFNQRVAALLSDVSAFVKKLRIDADDITDLSHYRVDTYPVTRDRARAGRAMANIASRR